MIVAGLPIWVVFIIASIITFIYWRRHGKDSKGESGIMSHWLVILLVFAIHFFWFGLGVIAFLIGEIVRRNMKLSKKIKE